MKAAPFIARWQSTPVVGNAFEAQLVLDDEACFAGHYPGAPIFPGTFLIEAAFQAAAAALGGCLGLEEIVTCRFHSPLLPRDTVAAHFTLKEAGAGNTLVMVTANGRAPAAELTLLVGRAMLADSQSVAGALDWKQAVLPSRMLDASFIARVLPHRRPALLVDSASLLNLPGSRPTLRARKAVTMEEPCFAQADKSGDLRYPRSLLVESFCQSCGLLRAATGQEGEPSGEGKAPVVAKLAGVRFFGDVAPGELVEHQVELVVRSEDGAVFCGQSVAAGRVVLQVTRVVAALAKIAPLRA